MDILSEYDVNEKAVWLYVRDVTVFDAREDESPEMVSDSAVVIVVVSCTCVPERRWIVVADGLAVCALDISLHGWTLAPQSDVGSSLPPPT